MSTKNKPKKPKYGLQQESFIKSVREAVDSKGADFFNDKNWRCIQPKGGKRSSLTSKQQLSMDSFYINPIVMWVPHLLFKDHLPTCPHCKERRFIDISESKWIDSPIHVFGRSNHCYMDTMNYLCTNPHCPKKGKGTFYGYHHKSLQ